MTPDLPDALRAIIKALETGAHTVDELAIIAGCTPAAASAWLEMCVCYRGARLAPDGDFAGKKRWTMKAEASQ